MNQQTIDIIQPYMDEYCKSKNAYDISIKNIGIGYCDHSPLANALTIYKTIMDACEKSIMQIIFENESNNQIEK